MKWSINRRSTRRVEGAGRAGAGEVERRVMWRDLVLESGLVYQMQQSAGWRKSPDLIAFRW